MNVTGKMQIGQESVFGSAGKVRSFDPSIGQEIEPDFGVGGIAEVDKACKLADAAFDSYRNTSPEVRAAFLENIADNLLELGSVLYERAAKETGLTLARIQGETGRTAAQLKMFATVVRQGRWRQATIDSGDPARTPLPKPDLRMHKIALGPVVVFGASNFPILYSVAGGDTASALAAGCPVVVKAHGSHLGTSELVGAAIQRAVKSSGLHEGVFSLIIGEGDATGKTLVDHPLVKAVAFTGSEGGGMALVRRGAERAEPIPVFAEMTSSNPNFVLPAALKKRGDEIAAKFIDQMALGVGQMCLKPGIILAVEGGDYERLKSALQKALSAKPPETMLSPGIHSGYNKSVERTRAGTKSIGLGVAPSKALDAKSELFEIDGADLLANPAIANEMFGPAALLVKCESTEQMLQLADSFHGQLTMALHLETEDYATAQKLLPILERKTNRIIANKFANQVEISFATIHGGPFPATSDPRFTSVGASAIDRFLRPVSYDNLPTELLPPALQDANPFELWRLKDGDLVKA
jgi:NADP-dependent aldehyde dehydrogenase